MQFTFSELGIKPAEYNGWTAETAAAEVINIAANMVKSMYIMKCDEMVLEAGMHNTCDYEFFSHFNWPVDFVNHTVTIPENAWA